MTSVIHKPVLMIDRGFQAYDATSWDNAFGDVIADRAKFVDENYNQYDITGWMGLSVDGYDSVVTPRLLVRAPEVMRFATHQLDHSRSKVVYNRKNLYKRDAYRCQYCSVRPRQDEITIDHILPRSRGGLSVFTNVVLCCLKCNLKKDNKMPEEAGMRLRRIIRGPDGKPQVKFYHRPISPRWNPHYSLPKLKEYPKTWKHFLQDKHDELYWGVELEP